MNLLLLQPEDFLGSDRVRLLDHRAQHIREVLKAERGQSLRCGLLGGAVGRGEITALGDTVELQVQLDTAPPAKLPLTLLLALPRPKAARRILRSATELGVADIILLNSYRVEKSYWQSPLLSEASLRAAMLEGLEQCGDTVLPTLTREPLFKPFVEDRLPGLLDDRQGLLAHPYGGNRAPDTGLPERLLAIGPEGGFIPYEVDKLCASGMHCQHFGQRILKVETAVPAIIAALFMTA